MNEIINGDCLEVMRKFPDNHFDSVVTDPPGGISFMGRTWDGDLGGRDRWVAWLSERMAEAYRVLKPGSHALVWSIPRTSHWTAWAIEDAGFNVRDCVLHLFGSGFPKSHNVSVAIDKAAGAQRAVVGKSSRHIAAGEAAASSVYAQDEWTRTNGRMGEFVTAPATPDAARWDGWGTALKPGQEMWWLARKPLAAGTIAANVLEFGTGALNIDGCRVGSDVMRESRMSQSPGGVLNMNGRDIIHGNWQQVPNDNPAEHIGRWPPNILLTHDSRCEHAGTRRVRSSHDVFLRRSSKDADGNTSPAYGAESRAEGTKAHTHGDADGLETMQAWNCVPGCPVGGLDRQSGTVKAGGSAKGTTPASGTSAGIMGTPVERTRNFETYGDTGGASRFFPQFTWDPDYDDFSFMYCAKAPQKERPKVDGITHPTTKPVSLMRWLVRLVTPPGGTVLDPFAGTGTTGEACHLEGFSYVLIEREPDYIRLIRERLSRYQPVLFGDWGM